MGERQGRPLEQREAVTIRSVWRELGNQSNSTACKEVDLEAIKHNDSYLQDLAVKL